MPPLGLVQLAVYQPSVDEMERTHELARTIEAPDLADRDYIRTHAEDGKASPANHSAYYARALGEGARRQAKKSLERRKPTGWCNKGHELTPENTYGRQCRTCRNQWKRDRRAQGLAA